MGTNYYYKSKEPCQHTNKETSEDTCWDCFDTGFEMRHIGKSSVGWTFSFKAYPELGINSFQDYLEELIDKDIYNEYGEKIYLIEFYSLIKSKQENPENKNHTIWCRNDENYTVRKHGEKDCYVDVEGYSFSLKEFS